MTSAVALFNTKALPLDEQPTTLAELAERAPELDGRIGTVEVENGQVGLGNFGYVDAKGEQAWEVLEELGPHTGVESGSGTLLGKLTASGKYVPSPATGADGSQTAVAILAYAVDATSADVTDAVIVANDAEVKKPMLIYHSSVDDDTKRNAKLAQLRAVNIKAR